MAELERLGKYEIRRVLGKGAMGVVYEGFDPDIERTVAIKTIRKDGVDPELVQQFMARFRNEARAAGRLHHPNIVGIYEYGEQETIAFIAMEFVHGAGLREYLNQRASFDFGQLASLIGQLLDALEFAHDRGIVHRDIKPANLIVTREAVLKVADFGVARIDRSNLTTAGMMIGTPSYMSPEQCMGRDADPRSDLFSVGVVLYELLTGEKPFTGPVETVTYKICHEDPRPPSAVAGSKFPEAVDRLIAKALAKDPQARFPSARAFREALREVAALRVSMDEGDGPTVVNMGTVALQVPAPFWDESTLTHAEHELARLIGPMARLVVRKAAARTHDRGELCALLSENIADPDTREQFVRSFGASLKNASPTGTEPSRARSGTRSTSATGASTSAIGAAPAPLDDAYIERVTGRLAVYVGPIAKVISRQAALRAYSREDFLRLVGEHLGTQERAAFLREVG